MKAAPGRGERAVAHLVFAALTVMAAVAAPAAASPTPLVLLALAAWWFGTRSRVTRAVAILAFVAAWFAGSAIGWATLIVAVVARQLVPTAVSRAAPAQPAAAAEAPAPASAPQGRRARMPDEVPADWPPRARDVIAAARAEHGAGALTILLRDPRGYVRAAAAEDCGHRRDSQAVPQLLPLLESEGVALQRAAAEALARIGTRDAVDALVTAFTRAWRAQTRMDDAANPVDTAEELTTLGRRTRSLRELAEALFLVGPPAIPALLEAVRDGSDEAAVWCVVPLGALGALDAVPFMLRRVSERHAFLRSRVREAIFRIGPRARPMLEDAARDGSPAARELAADLIRAFDGRPPEIASGPATRPA